MKATIRRLPLLAGLLAFTIVVAMIYTSSRARAQAPQIIELEGKQYMILTEAQAQQLAEIILKQRELLAEQAKKLKQGGCV